MSDINLNELHELISILEDLGETKEAQVLHNKFVKESQIKIPKDKESTHPYYKNKTYKVRSGDSLTSIAKNLLNQGQYSGDVISLIGRIEDANGGSFGKLQIGMTLLMPKPNTADLNKWNESSSKVPSVKKPNFNSPLFKRTED